MLPDFLGIGSQRTASTWLHEVLRKHPDLYLPDAKEVHYFDWKILNHDLAWYERHFEPAAGRARRPLVGEITPGYCALSRDSVESIRRLVPAVRPFIVLRHPVERSWSAALYELGRMSHRTFKQVPLLEVLRHIERPRNRRRSNYEYSVRTWREVFGAPSLHIALFDDFTKNRAEFLRGILRHIGADESWAPPPAEAAREVNASQHFEIPEMIRWYLASQWLRPTERLDALLGGRVSHWVSDLRATASAGGIGWRLARAVNRTLYAAPMGAAFAGFDAWRELRMRARWRSLEAMRSGA